MKNYENHYMVSNLSIKLTSEKNLPLKSGKPESVLYYLKSVLKSIHPSNTEAKHGGTAALGWQFNSLSYF